MALIKSPELGPDAFVLTPFDTGRSASSDGSGRVPVSQPEPSGVVVPPEKIEQQAPVAATAEAEDALMDVRRAQERAAEAALQRLLDEHQARLKATEERVAREGYAAGLARGELEAAARFAEAQATLIRLLDSATEGVRKVLADSEELIGAIVFEAVCKIVGSRLVTPEGAHAVVAEVLSRVRREEVVAIRVAPHDAKHIEAALGEGAELLGNGRLKADAGVELGGCIIEMAGGTLDGRIETQFRLFAQSLKDALRNQQENE